MKTISRYIMTLALLLTAVTGAWAQWTGGTYTATTNEELGAITVSADATLTINEGVTVTVTGGINVASGTLTVTGPGTLVVNGKAGSNGGYDIIGGTGGNGGVAISGNIIVQGGATVTATGGTGGNGGNGEFDGGPGGNGGNAFAGTLTYKSGTVTANGGSGGSGGWGEDGNASSGSAGKAFANDVDFTQTTGYSVTNGTSTIGSVLNQTKVVISGGTDPSAAPGPEVAWDAAKKTGTFVMPAYGVEIDPIYAPAAQWVKVEEVDQLPTAIEGIFAGTTDAIVKAGTVAMMGETENPQGQVMYALTSINQATAPALDAFSADVPTAGNIADEGADVLVWYYIQGANTPDGEEATAENTFNDSEICETPIKVTVLPNKYDIQFNAANDNTIEAGKATVKVGETAATVTEGKLEGVKMGSEVKLKAKEGYKFRKVEVEKNDGSKPLDESTVGMIVCTNGKAYPVNMKDNLPSGVTAVGIVAYKNGKNGLVMALTDEATNMNWDTATGNNGAKAHTPAVEGYSWKVPAIGEWQYNIFSGAGVGYLAGLSTYMTAAGGTGLQNGCYWTSTPKNNSYYARCIQIENGSINFGPGGNTELKSNGYHVRAVFAF